MLVSTRGRNPAEDFTYTAQKAGTWSMPLAVLIDGDSASASEIFAGAIRDHQRGAIVGSRSFRQRFRARDLSIERRQYWHSVDDGQVLLATG